MEWLDSLSPSAASFLGSLVGPALGLIAVLAGALFNAHLNRRRDDRLRSQEIQGWERALKVELEMFKEFFKLQSVTAIGSAEGKNALVSRTPYNTIIFQASRAELVLLPDKKINALIRAYNCLKLYDELVAIIIEETGPDAIKSSRYVVIPHSYVEKFLTLTKELEGVFDSALDAFK